MGHRVVVTGSRSWDRPEAIREQLEKLSKDTVVIHGGSKGADRIADEIAKELGLTTITVRPKWNRYGKHAGNIRNGWMLDMEPYLVLAFWDVMSPGTKDMIDQAHSRGIEVELTV
jgi:hypothetical protein